MSRFNHMLATTVVLALVGCWPVWWGDDGTGDDWCSCWSTSDTTCGYDSLGVCEDGCEYTYHDCDMFCRDAGFEGSEGCEWDWDTAQDACLCTDEPVSCDCTTGDTECWGEGFVMSCDDGCWWSSYDCVDLCRSEGYDTSTGCGYDSDSGDDACFCDWDVTCDCSSGELACWDDWSIGSCDDGCWWSVYDCDDLCVDSGWDYSSGCDYDPGAGEDVCFCEAY